jgi:hypothetical protein
MTNVEPTTSVPRLHRHQTGEGQDDYWLPIGAAFPHQSGDGYNIVLQALPIPDRDGQCKIVLRPPKDDKNETERDRQTIREVNDSRKGQRRER